MSVIRFDQCQPGSSELAGMVSSPKGKFIRSIDYDREISAQERLLQSAIDESKLLRNERDMLREKLSEANQTHDIDVRIVKEHRDALESYHSKTVKLEQQLADACKPSVSDVIFPQGVLDDIMMASNTMLAKRVETLEEELRVSQNNCIYNLELYEKSTAKNEKLHKEIDKLNKHIVFQDSLLKAVLFTGARVSKELHHIKSVLKTFTN